MFADPAAQTPVFVRFSTVVGFRGSADTVRDVRGFATKFYTEEGVWDLVGNNMPVRGPPSPAVTGQTGIPGGKESVAALKTQDDAIHFINEMFKHLKAIGATGDGCELLAASDIASVKIGDATSDSDVVADRGVVTIRNCGAIDEVFDAFSSALAMYRHWDRDQRNLVPT